MDWLDRFQLTLRRIAGSGAPKAGAVELRAARLVDEGNVLEDQGRIEEAMQRYSEAVRLAPSMARAHINYGNILLARGDAKAALDAYDAALAHKPDYAAAHYNRGNALARLGQHGTALEAYALAVRLDSVFVDALVALGNVQEDLGLLDEAAASYSRALAIRPGYAEVYYNLAGVQRKLGRLDSSENSCRRALDLQPELAEAHYNLGLVRLEQERRAEAEASFRKALECKPSYGHALAEAYHCANQLCNWSRHKEDEKELLALINSGTAAVKIFSMLAISTVGSEGQGLLQRQAALKLAEERLAPYLAHAPFTGAGYKPHERLHIGYVSADFHEHATMHLLQGVLESHDSNRLVIHAYSCGLTNDHVTRQVAQNCEIFRDISSLSHTDAAALIASDEIDILVDLKGYTMNTRIEISALRPAPVIVSWLGYPGTLGHPKLADYLVGDPIVSPPEHADHFSETLALMPHCYQPNLRERPIDKAPSRAQVGLPETGFVFCSFNQSYKFNPESFDIWCRLLREVPNSVLWLLSTSVDATVNLRREALSRGVSAERLIFAPNIPIVEHLGRLQLADLALDTFPINSHTTGSDALWAGVPLITRMGETFASRVAASLLHAVGLPELVTRNSDDYFALARTLALDPARLAAIRKKLADRRLSAPLFDTLRFTRDLERLYLRMWQQHAEGTKNMIILKDTGSDAL